MEIDINKKPSWVDWISANTYPSTGFLPRKDPDYLSITEDQINAWKEEEEIYKKTISKTIAENRIIFNKARDEFGKLLKLNSKEYKYVYNIAYPHQLFYRWDLKYSILDNIEKAKKDIKAKEMEKSGIQHQEEAIKWLLDRGMKLGTDFNLSNAINVADSRAYEEEIARKTQIDGFIEFDGQNCDGPCAGWDTKSNRCECGNRRVSWTEGWGHSFKNPSVYAEAH